MEEIKGKYLNAKQVYDAYGISRGMLGRLADAHVVTRKVIADEFATLYLYLAEDIENYLRGRGGDGNGYLAEDIENYLRGRGGDGNG